MSGWKRKRFWKEAEVIQAEDGFAIRLDGREVKTPAKASLVMPTQNMAEAVAAEWQAQEDEIKPLTMPFTRSANAAIDKVAVQHAEVADMLAAYGGTDLLCYRAESPLELMDRQSKAWQPLLDWVAQEFDAPLTLASGVVHVEQPERSTARLTEAVHALTNFELAAFHDLVAMSGSLVIALAVIRGFTEAEEGWNLSRVDEVWQAEQWGIDDEAADLAETKRTAFLHAERFFRLASI